MQAAPRQGSAVAGADGGRGWHPVPRFLIRSAGFGFATTDLRHPPLVAALAVRRAAGDRLARLLGEWSAVHFPAAVRQLEAEGADRSRFKDLYRLRRDVDRGRWPAGAAGPAVLEGNAAALAWARCWEQAVLDVGTAERDLDEQIGEAVRAGRRKLRELPDDTRFRAALAASGPDALARILRTLTVDPDGTRSATRQDERLLYAYAQRLATKNETTAFFGPVDYAELRRADGTESAARLPGDPATALEYTPDPVQACLLRLSHWVVQELATRAAADPAVRPYLPLALRDGCRLEAPGHLVSAMTGRRAVLAPDHAALLDALAHRGDTAWIELTQRQQGLADELLARGTLVSPLLVPAALDHPAQWLARRFRELEKAGATGVGRHREFLERLTSAADALAATGHAAREPRLRALEQEFTRTTGVPARRGAGEHYADRLVVGEDCRGAVRRCVVPEDGTRALASRLDPLLTLCGSFTVRVQRAVERHAAEVHRGLGGGAVPYLRLVAALDRTVSPDRVQDEPDVAGWLDRLDAAVLRAERAGVSTPAPDDLDALRCDLPDGLLASPDLLLGADPTVPGTSLAELPLIVGEIHHGAQVWTHLSALDPDPDRTARDVAYALRAHDPGIASVLHRRTQGKAFEREVPGPVVTFRTRPALPHDDVWRAEDLTVVADGDGRLGLRAPDGRALRLRPRHPRSAGNWLFGPPPLITPDVLRAAPRAPRVVIGDVVAWRRRWTLDTAALDALRRPTGPAALVRSADALVTRLALPDLVFVRADHARKPVFADLRCPTSLGHLAHHLRTARAARLTEMLPRPGQWWLRPGGRRVGCEWRLTFDWRPGDGRDGTGGKVTGS